MITLCVRILLIMNERPRKIFFSGIGGSGMSAIACFMADKGHAVTGSDRTFDVNKNDPLRKALVAKGIRIVPQDGKGIRNGFDFAVFSTAVDPAVPECAAAKELGMPIKSRPGYLAEITSSYKTIAVTGTSGKSTVSGMLAFLMDRLGLSPNFIGGGRVKQFKTDCDPGNCKTGRSDTLIFEACESDGTIVHYRPEHSIILNLALDHNPVEKTAGMFTALMNNTRSKTLFNNDDENLRKIRRDSLITFSVHTPSDYRADAVRYEPFSTVFFVNDTEFRLNLPGRHNLYNAMACIAMLLELGIEPDTVSSALREFQGIDRRFDVRLNDRGYLVIDDYAHNPHKIASLMATVRKFRKQICFIFQPHGFGPTRLMRTEYVETFIDNLRESDHLVLLPIFYAGGDVQKDISSHDLASEIRSGGRSVEVTEKRSDFINRTGNYKTYVVFGARDDSLSDFAGAIASTLLLKH
jgi:UDP-N-acetylmuramate--L-alanine ligase